MVCIKMLPPFITLEVAATMQAVGSSGSDANVCEYEFVNVMKTHIDVNMLI